MSLSPKAPFPRFNISEILTTENTEATTLHPILLRLLVMCDLKPGRCFASVAAAVKDREREIISASRHCNAHYGG